MNYFVAKSLGLSSSNVLTLSFSNGYLTMALTYPNSARKREYRMGVPATGMWSIHLEIRGSIVTFLRWNRISRRLSDESELHLTVDQWNMEREGRAAGLFHIQGERA
jgi:hypothetical protein